MCAALRPTPRPNLPLVIMGIVMGGIYILIGVALAFNLTRRQFLEPPYEQVLGWAVIVYGAFRLYRAVIMYSRARREV